MSRSSLKKAKGRPWRRKAGRLPFKHAGARRSGHKGCRYAPRGGRG